MLSRLALDLGAGPLRGGAPQKPAVRGSLHSTIHKSQGITAQEGTIVSFDGSKGRASVAKLGLAFVAWTRATSWSRVGFHKLPPFADFLAARLTREFSARADFEQKADALFVKLFGVALHVS